jgi:hypothetical protein
MELIDESAPFQIWHHGPTEPDNGSRAGDATRRWQQASSKICTWWKDCRLHHGSPALAMLPARQNTPSGVPLAGAACQLVSSDPAAASFLPSGVPSPRSHSRCIATGLDGGATHSGARFPPAFADAAAGEARDCRRARLEAYTACSAALRSSVEVRHPERIADVPFPLQLCINRLYMCHHAEHAAAPRPVA